MATLYPSLGDLSSYEFRRGETIHLYMGAIGVIPGVTLAEKRTFGSKLISGLMDVIINLGKRGSNYHNHLCQKLQTGRNSSTTKDRLYRDTLNH